MTETVEFAGEDLRRAATQLRGSEKVLDPDSLVMIECRRIRTGYLCLCSVNDIDIAVKIPDGWSARDASDTYEELVRTNAILGAATRLMQTVRPIGWTSSPPSLWVEYVHGSDLKTILSDPHLLAKWRERGLLASSLREVGLGLAAYHRETTQQPIEKTGIDNELARRTRLMLLASERLGRANAGVDVVNLYQDFSPANLRLASDGRIHAMDPPTTHFFGYPHKDMARFARGVASCFASPRWKGGKAEAETLMRELAEEFMASYAEATGIDVGSADHQWLMLLYETIRRWRRVVNQVAAANLDGAGRSVKRAIRMRQALADPSRQVYIDHLARMVNPTV